MTRIESVRGGGIWRTRVVATVGAAALLTAGGVAFASSASALPAPPTPTISLSAPAQIYNAGGNEPAQPVSITIHNSAVGAMTAAGTLTLSVAGVPTGVLCKNIKFVVAPTPVPGPPPGPVNPPTVPALNPDSPNQGGGTCTYSAPYVSMPVTGTTNLDPSLNYEFSVVNTKSTAFPNGQVGTLTETASFEIKSGNGNFETVTSNSVSTVLAGPTPPVATLLAVPAATVYRAYSFQVIQPGLPLGKVTVRDTTTDTLVPATACDLYQVGGGSLNCYVLNDGLTYNGITGYIYRYTSPTYNPDLHPHTYRIIENNTNAGPPTANLGQATITVAIANLFSDVPATSQFATAIYSLGQQDIIGGFADGTFRPTNPISRQAFAHVLFTATGGTDGSCSTNKPSAFSDVPSTSQFCKSIRTLSQNGVINGYADGTFHPVANVTRQASAAFLYRFYNLIVVGQTNGVDAQCSTPTPFNDVSASNPFCGDIEFITAQHYANGYADGGFHPSADTSRQAAVQILYNIITANPGSF